ILGDTLEKVAFEKAGIIKPGVPVAYPAVHGAAREVLDAVALERGAPIVARGRPSGEGNDVSARHAILALEQDRGVRGPDWAVAIGLQGGRWPGRFERCPEQPRLWWDGAHNPDGVRHLGELWRKRDLAAPARVVLAVSRDKDIEAMISELGSAFEILHLIAS